MKKSVSLLSIAALFLTLFSVCAPAIGAESDAVSTPLLADYTSEAKFDAAVADGKISVSDTRNAGISFDPEGALKITFNNGSATSDRNTGESDIYIDPATEMPVDGNEMIVAKVKAPSASFLSYADNAMAGTTKVLPHTGSNNNVYYNTKYSNVLDAGNGWLYVAYTNEDRIKAACTTDNELDETALAAAMASDWGRFTIRPHGDRYVEGDIFSIAWVGAFEDLATAKRWDLTGSTEPPGYSESYFFDYTDGFTSSNVNKVNNTVTTTAVYDETEKAIKISSVAESNGYTEFLWLPKTSASDKISAYPYFAIKVKAADATVTAPTYISHPRNGYSSGFGGIASFANGYGTYTPDEWSLVIIDGNSIKNNTQYNGTDEWWGLIYSITHNTVHKGSGAQLGWIQWAGAFNSIESAENYFAATTEQEEEVPVNKASSFYLDFTDSVNTTDKTVPYMAVEQATVEALSIPTTAIEHDAAMQAMKVSTADGYAQKANMAKIHFFDPSKAVATSDYPIFAMKVKMTVTSGGAAGSITRKAGGGWAVPALTHNAATTEWQLAYFDASTVTSDVPQWDLNIINLINNNTTDAALYDGVAETVAYVQWAGAYRSVEDAQKWFDYTTPAEDETDALSCTTAGIRKELDKNGNQGLRFYQTLKTTMVDGLETVEHKGETLEVLTVYALMATEDTLTGAGLTATDLKSDLVGNVPMVAKVKITNCRSRVVDGDTITYTFTVLLTNVMQKNKRTNVCTVAYLLCRNTKGELVEVYGNVQSTNVKKMYDAIGTSKFTGDIQDWMAGRAEGLFLDFVDEQTMSQVAVNEKTTTISYSPENSAVLVSPLADGLSESNTIHLYPTADVSVKDYPVFAMRIKLKNPNVTYGSFYWRTEASNEIYSKVKKAGGSIVWMQRVPGTEMTYAATDDWQIVYTNMRDIHNPLFTGNWKDVMNVMLSGTESTTEDGIYIDWMGAFATVGDAFAHAGVEWEGEESYSYADLTETEKEAKDNAWQINNELSSEMTTLTVETQIVDDYDPQQDVYAFRHHPSLAYFGGKWYAGFSNGVSDEDAPGQKMVYSVSDNFTTWSDPIDLVLAGDAAMGTENRSADNADLTEKGIVATQVIGGFSVVSDRLYFYYTVQEYTRSCFDENGVFKGMRGATTDSAVYRQYGIYTTDGINWSQPKAVSSLNRYSTLQKSPHSDKWFSICGFRIHYSDTNEIDPDVRLSSGMMTNDQIVSSRERCPGTLSETSYYQGPDGVLHLMCRSETGYIWAATSMDEGKTWSEFYPTNFTSASSMFTHIMLPDGRIAWVGSPYYDTRWPLTLYISEDGYNFDKAYILQDEIYDMKEDPAGWAKGGAFAYPKLVIKDDYLYILYTKQKEVVEICRVLLKDIQ